MANTGQNVKDEALREVAFGSINATYTALGSPFTHDILNLTFTNGTDAAIYVSFDGVTDHKKFLPNSGRVWDLKTNDSYRKAGTQPYIKYDSAPSQGWAGLEAEYV